MVEISNLAKYGMIQRDYDVFMSKINNKQLNSARLFVEDKMDEIVFSKNIPIPNYVKLGHLKKLDTIITNEYINQLDVNGPETVSK